MEVASSGRAASSQQQGNQGDQHRLIAFFIAMQEPVGVKKISTGA
jgi:hypothetical protein